MNQPSVIVYLMTGFLDSGKTQFFKFTLSQDYFQIRGKTLMLLCEDGEEECDNCGDYIEDCECDCDDKECD